MLIYTQRVFQKSVITVGSDSGHQNKFTSSYEQLSENASLKINGDFVIFRKIIKISIQNSVHIF